MVAYHKLHNDFPTKMQFSNEYVHIFNVKSRYFDQPIYFKQILCQQLDAADNKTIEQKAKKKTISYEHIEYIELIDG